MQTQQNNIQNIPSYILLTPPCQTLRSQDPAAESAELLDPQTMKQLQLLRENYSNTAAFAADLLQDRTLQKQARLICHVLNPLHSEYQSDLKAHSDGQTYVLYWHGDRASGTYYRNTVVKMFELLKDTSIVSLLGLRQQPSLHGQIMEPSSPLLETDTKLVQQFFRFVMELRANRCWSQSFWTLLFPYNIAGLYATDTTDRRRCQMLCKRLANALLALEDAIQKSPANHDLRVLRDSLGTADWALVREILKQGHDCDWDPNDAELRLLVFTLFAGPGSTKDSLESAFNFLKDSVKSSKSKKMGPFTRFFYTLANPYARHAGVEQIRPTMEHFKDLLQEGFKDNEVLQHHLFAYKETPLGKNFPRPEQLMNAKVRKAGFHSNRNAAAAAAFMLHDAAHGFSHAGQCWPG